MTGHHSVATHQLLSDSRVERLRPLPRWLYVVSSVRCEVEGREHVTEAEAEAWLSSRDMTGREHDELLAADLWRKLDDGSFEVRAPVGAAQSVSRGMLRNERKTPAEEGAGAELLDTYLRSLMAVNTRRAFAWGLRGALAGFPVQQLAEVTPMMLSKYRASVLESGLSSQSQATKIKALRSFLRWARSVGEVTLGDDVIEATLRVPSVHVVTPYEVLNDDEVSALLVAAGTRRDRAIIAVMVGAGLRISEVVALNVGDVRDGEVPCLIVRQGKGRKDRVVPLAPGVSELLRLVAAPLQPTAPPLFVSGPRCIDGRRLSKSGVTDVLRRAVRRAGLTRTRITPHALRHTFATRAERAGASVTAISTLLGHSNLTTTSRYLRHLQLPELARAVPPLPGPATTSVIAPPRL